MVGPCPSRTWRNMRRRHDTARFLMLTTAVLLAARMIPAKCLPASASLQDIKIESCVRVVADTSLVETARTARRRAAAMFRTSDELVESAATYVSGLLQRSPGVVVTATVIRRRTLKPAGTDWETEGTRSAKACPWQESKASAKYFLRTADSQVCRQLGPGTQRRVFVQAPCCDVQPPVATACLLDLDEMSEQLPQWATTLGAGIDADK